VNSIIVWVFRKVLKGSSDILWKLHKLFGTNSILAHKELLWWEAPHIITGKKGIRLNPLLNHDLNISRIPPGSFSLPTSFLICHLLLNPFINGLIKRTDHWSGILSHSCPEFTYMVISCVRKEVFCYAGGRDGWVLKLWLVHDEISNGIDIFKVLLYNLIYLL